LRVPLFATTLAFLAGCGSAVERSLIYHPLGPLDGSPRDYGLAFEDVRLTTKDGVPLHGWHVPGRRAAALFWCHGNAGNISHRLENLALIHDRLGVGVLLFDYRGYGESGGLPSEAGTYEDARAFRAWLRTRNAAGTAPVIYFGRSLGAAVAATLALEDPPTALILETPFTSVRAMANATLPGVGYFFRTRYDTLGRIGGLRAPLLILHGDADEVVPFRYGQQVFDAAPQPKAFFRIPRARHNDTYVVGGKPYWEAWERFLAIHIPGW
jgi:fermentation-respiration switch protein FrsA (DUF1100 family)